VSIAISKATPAFSGLASPVITYGTGSTDISGKINLGTLAPTGTVAITMNGVTQNAAIGADGSFLSKFATGALPPATPPYSIAYSYAGDVNFNGANGARTLTVTYGVTPLYHQTKAAKGGSTIPIKFQLANANGDNVSSASVLVTAVQLVLVSTNASSNVSDSGNANPDNNFRFDGAGYIFNLSTKGLASGVYNLIYRVQGDPLPHALAFEVR